MGLGWLLVPAVPGYFLQRVLYLFRFHALRETGQHVVYRSTLTGIVLVFLAQLILHFASRCVPSLETYLRELFGFEFAPVAILSFILALAAWPILNLFTDLNSAIIRAAEQNGDLKGAFLTKAIATFKTVEVSLNTGKIYIGKVMRSGIGIGRHYDLLITPLFSGYRNRETNELKITHFYYSDINNTIIETKKKDDKVKKKDWHELGIGISLSDVISVRFFDPTLYRESSSD